MIISYTSYKEIAGLMADYAAILNISEDQENIRENPIYSELYGMQIMLKHMNVASSFDFDENVEKITAVIVGSERVEVK